MIARGPTCRHGLRSGIALCLALAAVMLATPAGSQPLFSGSLACPANAPLGATVGKNLLNGLTNSADGDPLHSPLNTGWQKAAGAIPNQTIVLNRVHDTAASAGCTGDVTSLCQTVLVGSHCSFLYVNMTLHNLTGLNKLGFPAAGLTVSGVSERNVAEHTNQGPDASVITDGVFAPEGSSSTDTAYSVVLLHNAKQGALVIDLGQTTSLCGVASGCSAPKIQADNDDVYQVDYSTDGSNWSSLGAFPKTGGSGLHTRSLSGSGFPSNFSARYVAVYATSGGSTFAVSELQLFNTANKLVSVGKPVVGPVPYEIFDGVLPSKGHSSTDPTVSVELVHKTGSPTALMVDLGSVKSICGATQSACLHQPTIEADNDDTYMLDYSLNGKDWTTYGNYYNGNQDWHSATFPSVGGSGLQTRDMNCSARPDLTVACGGDNQGPNFNARYVRVYARSGGDTFAVAELQLWDTAGNPIPVIKTYTNPQQYAATSYSPHASGPEPFFSNGEYASEGTAWDDVHYATKLGACTATSSCPSAAPATASPVSSAKQIDLTALFNVSSMAIQADSNDTYQVDGWDGTSMTSAGTPVWAPLWTVPTASGDGLRTRTTSTFTTNPPSARFVRVYATAGDGKFSVSELQVFTAQANTAGTYANVSDSQGFPRSDGGANDGQNFVCSYDGTFDSKLSVIATNADGSSSLQDFSSLPIGFHVDSVQLGAHCVTDLASADVEIGKASNRNCSMTLLQPASYAAPFTDGFQAGACASPPGRAIMSYMQFDNDSGDADNSAIQFVAKDPLTTNPNPSDLQCDGGSIDAHIPDVLRGFVPEIAAAATRQALNVVLDFHVSPSSLIPFPVVKTSSGGTTPVQCDGNLGGVEPPTPAPDNISGIAGRATQVGTGSDSGTLRITGTFGANQSVALDQARLNVHALLQEIGVGELVQGPDGATILLPIGLETQNGSSPGKGMYRSPPGAKPMVSARIDAQNGSMSFEIDVQRATVAEPEACLKGSASALLRTSFVLVGASADPIPLQGGARWECKGAQLVTAP